MFEEFGKLKIYRDDIFCKIIEKDMYCYLLYNVEGGVICLKLKFGWCLNNVM